MNIVKKNSTNPQEQTLVHCLFNQKVEICGEFILNSGQCRFAPRCNFLHADLESLRRFGYSVERRHILGQWRQAPAAPVTGATATATTATTAEDKDEADEITVRTLSGAKATAGPAATTAQPTEGAGLGAPFHSGTASDRRRQRQAAGEATTPDATATASRGRTAAPKQAAREVFGNNPFAAEGGEDSLEEPVIFEFADELVPLGDD